MSASRRTQPRSAAFRRVSGILGVALLVAVTAGTWWAISLDYAPEPPAEEMTFHVPAKPVAPPTNTDYLHVPQSRLLIHLVAVEASPGGLIPLHAEEFDVQWPGQSAFAHNFWAGEHHFDYRFVINAVYYSRTRASDKTATFKVAGKHNYTVQDSDGKSVLKVADWTDFGKRDIIDLMRVKQDQRPMQPVLSIMPRSSRGNIHLLLFATPVAADDRLGSTSWQGFCQKWGNGGEDSIRAEIREPWSGTYSGSVDKRPALRGLALLDRWGFAGLLLLAAALLLTQLFVHRVLAFPAVLATVVLYSAALDSAVLGVHRSRLNDPRSALTTRIAACDRLGYTFFFRKSAIKHLTTLTQDVQTPDALSYLANDALLWLRESKPQVSLPTAFTSFVGDEQAVLIPDLLASERGLPPAFVGSPSNAVGDFAFSPDGKLMAVCVTRLPGAAQRDIELWDMTTRKLQYSIAHLEGVESLAFSPDGNSVATVNSEYAARPSNPNTLVSVARLWNLRAKPPRVSRTLSLGQFNNTVAFSPNGKMLLCSGDGQAQLWDIAGGATGGRGPRWTWKFYNATDLGWTPPPPPIFSPDSKTVALVGKVGWVRSIDQPDMLVSTGGGAVELWDIPKQSRQRPRLRRILPVQLTNSLAFSPNGKQLVCVQTVYEGGQTIGHAVQMLDVKAGTLQWRRLTDSKVNTDFSRPFSPAFSPDGKMLAIVQKIEDTNLVTMGNRIELWDTRTGSTRRRMQQLATRFESRSSGLPPVVAPARVISGLVFSPDGKTLAIHQSYAVRLLEISGFSAVPE